ncbi:MAG: Ig-like domain-containing protein, partial [Paludibacteraceae bacterium]|nr:Ig-like domain-containing protein [Paludibacteraceae bacterium]
MKHYLYIILAIFLVFLYSCANMGSGPQGGPKDMTPPKLVKSEPAQNQTNVKSKKIVLEFDEIVLLDKVAEQLVISPPQKNMPEIQAINKKITIVLKDTLQPNTTYNITLGDAITDNKEKTALKNFSLAFSTGNEIDTLSITGYVLWANNLSKAKGVTVGI